LAVVKEKGLNAVVGGTLETAGSPRDFREHEPRKVKTIADMFLATMPEGYIGCGEAVRDMDHREIIKSIKAPTMIIAGKQDAGTTVEMGNYGPQEHSGRQHDAIRRRPHRQCRVSARIHRRRDRHSATPAQLTPTDYFCVRKPITASVYSLLTLDIGDVGGVE